MVPNLAGRISIASNTLMTMVGAVPKATILEMRTTKKVMIVRGTTNAAMVKLATIATARGTNAIVSREITTGMDLLLPLRITPLRTGAATTITTSDSTTIGMNERTTITSRPIGSVPPKKHLHLPEPSGARATVATRLSRQCHNTADLSKSLLRS
jgi:hypothetical protein